MSTPSTEPAPLETVVLHGDALEADPAEVIRYLGYPHGARPNPMVAERAQQAAEQARGKVRPRGMYSLYRVLSCDKRTLSLAGGETFVGPIGEFLGHSEQAAAFVATAGPEVVEMGDEQAKHGDILGQLAFHALGAALAEVMVERVVAHLESRIEAGKALTMRYSPGYCGISLQQQRKLFSLLDASRVGVELMPSMIMKPIKSVSGLVGVGPAAEITAYGNPCTRCPLTTCAMRR